MKKSVLNSARLLRDSLPPGKWRAAFLTLTYAKDGAWRPDHISALIDRTKSWMRSRGMKPRYVWVSELTKAGRVHYHAIFFLPLGVSLPKPDKRGWWPHGSTRIEWVRKVLGYLVKYASKGSEAEARYPKGLRICGSGGVDADGRRERAWWRLPSYVRGLFPLADRPRRAVGGGFVSEVTGEWIAARYKFLGLCPGGCRLIDLWGVSE